MPTNNPRITFTVSQELFDQIDDYRYKHRMRNQTQAIISLINLGFEAINGKPLNFENRFTEDEVEIVKLYRSTEPLFQDVAVKILRDNQKQEKSRA